MATTASPLELLPAEISNRIYAYALISDAPLRVCQISNLLSVFDDRAVETLRLMAETSDNYHFSGYSYDEADDKKESMILAIDTFVAAPLFMGRALQNFSFLRRATTIYVANAAPPEMQSFQPISIFDGPNRAHVVFPGLLATSVTIRRQAAPIYYANNTFDFDDIETALSYLVNLDRCYRSHIRKMAFAVMSLFSQESIHSQYRQLDVAASFCWMLDHWLPSFFYDMPLTMCLKDWLYPVHSYYLQDNMLDFCLGRVAVLKAGFHTGELIIPFNPSGTMVDQIARLALMSGLEHVEVAVGGDSNDEVACRTPDYPYVDLSGEEHAEIGGLMTLRRREHGIVRDDYRNKFVYVAGPRHGIWQHKYQKLQEYVGLICELFELPSFERLDDERRTLGEQIAMLETTRF